MLFNVSSIISVVVIQVVDLLSKILCFQDFQEVYCHENPSLYLLVYHINLELKL